jgi:tripartite-type tricarboxylate transporter receptor subunit TctC
MISGRIDAMFIDTGNALPRVGKDNLRALGVSTEERIGALPDVPTFREIGLADVISATWFAVVAPAKTGPDIRRKISDEIARVSTLPDIKSSLDKLGVQIVGSTPEELQRWLGSENARWSQTIRRANIKAEQQ